MRVQNHLGNGVVFLNEAVGESLDEALRRIAKGEFAAVFCEAPSNPLLRTVDLSRVSEACRDGGVCLLLWMIPFVRLPMCVWKITPM